MRLVHRLPILPSSTAQVYATQSSVLLLYYWRGVVFEEADDYCLQEHAKREFDDARVLVRAAQPDQTQGEEAIVLPTGEVIDPQEKFFVFTCFKQRFSVVYQSRPMTYANAQEYCFKHLGSAIAPNDGTKKPELNQQPVV